LKEPVARNRIDPDHTIGGRLAAALVSVVFTAPVCFVLWLFLNTADLFIPITYYIGAMVLVAALALLNPKIFPTIFGWLCRLVLAMFN